MGNKCDVLIVGAGTTGIPAAIFATNRGANVILIDSAEKVGGTLHLSSGSLSAAGSSLQNKKGIKDTPENHLDESININHGTGDMAKLKLWQENSADTLEWLLSIGLEYPENQPVAAAGHEPYKIARITTPSGGGKTYIPVLKSALMKIVKEGKCELKLNTRMKNIISGSDGVVEGVVVVDESGSEQSIYAKSILLACGGYSNSDELWKEYHNRPKRVYTYKHSNGDGIKAALKLGAKVGLKDNLITTFGGTVDIDNEDDYWIHTLTFPAIRKPWEIFVNNNGKRFLNEEELSQDFRERTIMNQPDWSCWLIYDETINKESPPLFRWDDAKIDRAFKTHSDFCKAETLDELAKKCNLPFDNLYSTIKQFNLGRKANSDSWGRKHMPLPIEHNPFYAIKHYAISVVSFGGIVCDDNLKVLDKNNKPFKNLYAGGEMLGMGIWGNAYLGGSSVGGCLTMGKLLGQKFLNW